MKTPEWMRTGQIDETGREKINWWRVLLLVVFVIACIAFIFFLVTGRETKEETKATSIKTEKWEEPTISYHSPAAASPAPEPAPEVKEEPEEKATTEEKEEKKEDPRVAILARLGKEGIEPYQMDHERVLKFQEFAGASGGATGCDILPATIGKLKLLSVVNTDSGGTATAILEEPIPGPDGCIAMDMGAKFVGVVDQNVQIGQSKANISWVSITTADNRVVEIQEMAGDAMGSGGVPGKVNRHWGSKFAGVAVSTAVDLAKFALGGGGSGFSIIMDGPGDVLDDFARQFINRKDTITHDPMTNGGLVTVTFTKRVKL